MNVYFGIIKNNRYVLHQPSNRKLWKNFIDGIANEIPDIIIADINDFLNILKKIYYLKTVPNFIFGTMKQVSKKYATIYPNSH